MVNFTANIYDLRSAISPLKIIQISCGRKFINFSVAFQIMDSIFGQQLLFKRKHHCVSRFHLYRDYEPVSHRF